MLPLKKSIFITGGTSGIGAELALRYSKAGMRVAVLGRSREKYETFLKDSSIQFFQADITDKIKVKEAIEEFSQDGLDILIASHGVSHSQKSQIPDFEQSRTLIEINLIGVINAFEVAFMIMKNQKRGQLVAIASIAGFNGLPGASAYSASKSAVIKLCESYAIDFKRWNIDVSCINPGFVDTPLTKKNPHPMPFLMSSEKASELIMKAIEKKKVSYSFPYFFSTFVFILSWIPRSIYVKLFKVKVFNFSIKNEE